MRDGTPFAFAGLWEVWAGVSPKLATCCHITTGPNELVLTYHDRMSVILPAADYPRWLDPTTPQAELIKLLVPYPAEMIDSIAVSNRVNKVAKALSRNNSSNYVFGVMW